MTYNELNSANATSTDEIKRKLIANDSETLSQNKLQVLLKQAKQMGYEQGFKEAQAMYKIDSGNIDTMMRSL